MKSTGRWFPASTLSSSPDASREGHRPGPANNHAKYGRMPRTAVWSAARALRARVVASAVVCFALTAAGYLSIPLPDPLFPADYSFVVQDRHGQTLRVFLNSDEQWILPPGPAATPAAPKSPATPLEANVPEVLQIAVTQFEDRRFWSHGGVDLFAVGRALVQNTLAGRQVSGASTLTMQVARLIEEKPRTIGSKIIEILQAIKLEGMYSKGEILSLYLNHAPYGGNTRGFRTAAYRYFGKDASRLTWAEATTLAVLPNAPATISPVGSSRTLTTRRNQLLTHLHAQGFLDAGTLELALEEPVPSGAISFPVHAPHLADRLRIESARTSPREYRATTTVDLEIQRLVERQAEYHGRYLRGQGISNVSALVAATETGEVLAYLGSQDYFDDSINGSIDGISAYRSTGSILKPFLYALAMDEGMFLPQTSLEDVPVQFGAYSPSNIDGEFRGLISAHEALAQSRNVPAVSILHEYGLTKFYRFLREAGMEGLFRSPDDYGLPLILGGAEATPFEMATMYRGLAFGGRFAELRYTLPAPLDGSDAGVPAGVPTPRGGTQLISPGAAYLTLDILTDVARPGVEQFWAAYQGSVPVAWKTGTSYGRRDAWAIGVTPRYTVLVWTGNFTGEENANLTSTVSAGTLLFDLFNALPESRGAGEEFRPPAGSLVEVETCLETGYRATRHCADTTRALAPADARALAPCPYHRTIYTNLDGSYRVDSSCWVQGEYRARSQLFYPPAVSQYLRTRGVVVRAPPPFAEGCAGDTSPNSLTIVYPNNEARLAVPRDLDGGLQRVLLRAAHQEAATRLFWYLNGEYVGETADPHVLPWTFSTGEYQLTVVDEHGNRAESRFYVATREGR